VTPFPGRNCPEGANACFGHRTARRVVVVAVPIIATKSRIALPVMLGPEQGDVETPGHSLHDEGCRPEGDIDRRRGDVRRFPG
jgi:hypothetical protein